MTDPIYVSDVDREIEEAEEAEVRVDVLSIDTASAGVRLDRYLSDACHLTRAAAVRLIEAGCVVLESGEGKGRRRLTPDKNTKLKAGDTITVTHPEAEAGNRSEPYSSLLGTSFSFFDSLYS